MQKMRVGFYGPAAGVSRPQGQVLLAVLASLGGQVEGHHCDNIGADATFHDLARGLGWHLTAHPAAGNFAQGRAICDVVEPALPPEYQVRALVEAVDALVLCPTTEEEDGHDRTWDVIKEAMRQGRAITVIWPDGGVRVEG